MGLVAYPVRPARRRYVAARPVQPAAARVKSPVRWLVIPFVLAVVILAGTAAYAFARPQSHADLPGPGSRGSLVWGDGLFASRVEMKAWLTLHGAAYRAWAQSHPAALKLLPKRGG